MEPHVELPLHKESASLSVSTHAHSLVRFILRYLIVFGAIVNGIDFYFYF